MIIGDTFFTSPAMAKSLKRDVPSIVPGIKEDLIAQHVAQQLTTDFDGKGVFENLSPGEYWIIGYTEARAEDEIVVWNHRIVISGDKKSEEVLLDQNNAYKITSGF